MTSSPFTEAYYMDGQATGLSNYKDYQWMPDLTLPMADHLRWLLDFKPYDAVLDFGCARGYLVKALRMRGVDARGHDISEWAIANCDPYVKSFVASKDPFYRKWDHIVSKDVFEHIPVDTLETLVPQLLGAAVKQLFIIVPLAQETGGTYACPVDEQDSTHVIRWTLTDWIEFMQKQDPAFVVTGGYQAPGLKPNCYEYPRSYGFITARRIAP